MTAIPGYGNSASISSVDATLKELYDDRNFFDACYKNRPTWAMIEKFENMKGASNADVRGYRVPFMLTRPQGIGAGFTQAQAQATPSNLDAFIVTRYKHYCVATLDGEVMAVDIGDASTFASYIMTQTNAALSSFSDQISSLLFGTGTGVFGQISATSNVGTPTITLANINSVTLFEANMTLGATTTNNGSDTAEVGTVVLAAVDRYAGTLTVQANGPDVNWDDFIPTIAAGDYLFVNSNLDAVFPGIPGWNPATPPVYGSDNWYGVDRGIDPTRAAGLSFQSGVTSGASYEEIILDALAFAVREGAQIDKLVLSPYDMAQLQKTQQSRVVLTRNPDMTSGRNAKGPMAGIGFTTYTIDSMGMRVDVYQDNKCPQGTGFGFANGTYVMGSVGGCPKILDFDGLWCRAVPDYDAYSVRAGFYGNLFSRQPNNAINIGFPVGNALP